MTEKYKSELLLFLKLTEKEQQDILHQYNNYASSHLSLFDIVPVNIDKNPQLQDFADFLILSKKRCISKRKLIYIPIVHTEDDMGSMAEYVKKEYKRKLSRKEWQRHENAVKELWVKIQDYLLNLDLNWNKTRIYQDGLPVCGKELDIVKELAEKGSLNHKLIFDLQQKGAIIEGTENPKLLLADYNYIINIAHAKNLAERDKLIEKYSEASRELLNKRDRFIADRINKTLKNNETGILFLGLMHRANKLIEKTMNVQYLNIGDTK